MCDEGFGLGGMLIVDCATIWTAITIGKEQMGWSGPLENCHVDMWTSNNGYAAPSYW